MDYLLTWISGEEVDYRFVSAEELETVFSLEKEKHNFNVIPLH
ncbi:MAG: hypothetical protein AB2448_07305 [Moorella sp. (in: firmicutes)]